MTFLSLWVSLAGSDRGGWQGVPGWFVIVTGLGVLGTCASVAWVLSRVTG